MTSYPFLILCITSTSLLMLPMFFCCCCCCCFCCCLFCFFVVFFCCCFFCFCFVFCCFFFFHVLTSFSYAAVFKKSQPLKTCHFFCKSFHPSAQSECNVHFYFKRYYYFAPCCCSLFNKQKTNELVHDKTYNKICVTSKTSDWRRPYVTLLPVYVKNLGPVVQS